MGSDRGARTSRSSPWECPSITRWRWRKALRWCASVRPCSAPVARVADPGRPRGPQAGGDPQGAAMAGVWRKTLQYLGLVEDEDLEDLDDGIEPGGARSDPAPVRRLGRAEVATVDRPEAIVRTMPTARTPTASIHRAEPKRFNEAPES